MTQREKFVAAAKAWLGYSEANGKHRQIIDLYNAQKPLPAGYKVIYTDAWCATFVSACGIKAGLGGIVLPECSCERMIALYKAKGLWQEDESITPQPGDIIMYDWQDNGVGDCKGVADHVGIVESVSGGNITVIEGNMANAVGRRSIKVNAKCIRGYCLPKFAEGVTVDALAENAAKVKARFGFDDNTMRYLRGYKYAAALLERLATK